MNELRKKLESLGIKIHGTIEEFYGEKGHGSGLWTGEGGDKNDEVFDYYNSVWPVGVDPEIEKIIKAHGYWPEWYDGGTLMIYKGDN